MSARLFLRRALGALAAVVFAVLLIATFAPKPKDPPPSTTEMLKQAIQPAGEVWHAVRHLAEAAAPR